jgi:hypothetical protein
MADPESDAINALDRLFLQSGVQGGKPVFPSFSTFPFLTTTSGERVPPVRGSHPGPVPCPEYQPSQVKFKLRSRSDLLIFLRMPQVTDEPNYAPPFKSTRSTPPIYSRQPSRGPPHRVPERSSNPSHHPSRHASPSCRQVVIDASDGSGDEQPLRLATSNGRPARLTTSAITPSPSGSGGHIFHVPTHETSVDVPGSMNTDEYHSHLRFRNPEGVCKPFINDPADGDIGDGSGWYYVTVGKVVGVFNTW